ncbi:MAG: hypothetical protein ACXAD7_15050 [Candidatus Kariarchaeaceae archaeon]|jgi:hypothetical protein
MRQNNREKDLIKEGWTKRTILDEPRLSEVVELYESLGFKVLLEPIQPDQLGKDCKSCYLANCDKFKAVFIKKQSK